MVFGGNRTERSPPRETTQPTGRRADGPTGRRADGPTGPTIDGGSMERAAAARPRTTTRPASAIAAHTRRPPRRIWSAEVRSRTMSLPPWSCSRAARTHTRRLVARRRTTGARLRAAASLVDLPSSVLGGAPPGAPARRAAYCPPHSPLRRPLRGPPSPWRIRGVIRLRLVRVGLVAGLLRGPCIHVLGFLLGTGRCVLGVLLDIGRGVLRICLVSGSAGCEHGCRAQRAEGESQTRSATHIGIPP